MNNLVQRIHNNADKIQFDEGTHTYRLKENPRIRLRSCTGFIENFFEPFNAFKIATKLVNNFPKYAHRTVDSLIEEWDDAKNAGTAVHMELSDYLLRDQQVHSQKAKQGINWFKASGARTGENYLSEVVVFDKSLGLAGTIDLVLIDPDDNTCTIVDWKTNKEIKQHSFRGKVGTKPPSRGLMDCNYIHYSLQLSLYKYLLERSCGVKVKEMIILHLLENDYEEYQCDDYRTYLDEMLEYSA